MKFQIGAVIILLVFYGCYFFKMLIQNRKGIQTDQIGKGKVGLVRNKVNLNEVKEWMKNAFEKDYNDLSDNTKEIFKEKYELILKAVINN